MGRSERRHVVEGVAVARTFRERLMGLMGRRDLSSSYLLIPKCGAVHTCFMMGRIDIVFLDAAGRVTAAHPEVRPWRLVSGPAPSASTLELPPGEIRRHTIQIGDSVECQCI